MKVPGAGGSSSPIPGFGTTPDVPAEEQARRLVDRITSDDSRKTAELL
ncbi:hypothetical protein [Streptomyces sp. NPDC046832]